MNEFEIEARADGSLRLECARTHEMTSKKKTRCNPIAAATTSTNERREWGEKRVQQKSSQNFANRTRRSVSFVRTEPDAEAKAQHRAKFSKSNHDLRQLTKNCTIFFFFSSSPRSNSKFSFLLVVVVVVVSFTTAPAKKVVVGLVEPEFRVNVCTTVALAQVFFLLSFAACKNNLFLEERHMRRPEWIFLC